MSAPPSVSVIVPVYNTGDEVGRCLESLAAQSLADIEVIVVNDGSTDRSQAVIDGFVARGPAMFQAVSKSNGGLADARNAGLAVARGEFVGFVDSDDYVAPQMFSALLERATATGADVVVCEYVSVDHAGTVLSHYREGASAAYGVRLRENPALLGVCGTSACNKLFRRSLFTDNGIAFPAGLDFEDLAIVYHLFSHASRIEKVDAVLYSYTQTRTEALSRAWTGFVQLPRALALLEHAFRDDGVFETYRTQLESLAITHLITGRFPDLFAHGDRAATASFIAAAFGHLDDVYPGWRAGAALATLCPSPWLRTIASRRALLSMYAALPARAVLGLTRRSGLFDPPATGAVSA